MRSFIAIGALKNRRDRPASDTKLAENLFISPVGVYEKVGR
jgi:hypothetical protein